MCGCGSHLLCIICKSGQKKALSVLSAMQILDMKLLYNFKSPVPFSQFKLSFFNISSRYSMFGGKN